MSYIKKQLTETMSSRYFKPEFLPMILTVAGELLGKTITAENEDDIEDCEVKIDVGVIPGYPARIRYDENDHPGAPTELDVTEVVIYVTDDPKKSKTIPTGSVDLDEVLELLEAEGPDEPDYDDDWRERQNELAYRNRDRDIDY